MKQTKLPLFSILLFLGLFLLTLRPIEDPDFWWHLKTGELISESTTIPKTDQFSFTRGNYPWIAHEWLSELIIYQIYKLGGFHLLILIFSLTITLSYFLTYYHCREKPYIAGFLILMSALASAPTWGVRPQTLSLLLTALFIFILREYQKKRNWRYLLSLPFLSLLWVNLHGSYIIGLVIILVYFFVELYILIQNRRQNKTYSFRPVTYLFITLLACLTASLINPNGINILIYPFTTLFSPSMMQFIQEWYSPDFHQIEWLPLAILFLLLIAIPAIFRQPSKPVQLILVVIFSFAALRSMRFSSMLSLVAAPFLSDQLIGIVEFRNKQPALSIRKIIFNSILFLILLMVSFIYTVSVLKNQPGAEERNYPKGAVEWIIENKPEGNIYNTYGYGGYLIWRLYPEYEVFIDGRADVYGDEFIYSFLEAYSGDEGWENIFERYSIKIALVENWAGITDELLNSAQWNLVYQDSLSVLFIKE